MLPSDSSSKKSDAATLAWRVVWPAALIALALGVVCLASYTRHAATCTGDLVRDPARIGPRSRDLPVVATPRLLSSRDAEQRFDPTLHETHRVYDLPPFRLEANFAGWFQYEAYAGEQVSIVGPSSCNDALFLFDGSTGTPPPSEAMTLRRDDTLDEWVVLFRAPFHRSRDSYEELPPDPRDFHVGTDARRTGAVVFRETGWRWPQPSHSSTFGAVFLLTGVAALWAALRARRHRERFEAIPMSNVPPGYYAWLVVGLLGTAGALFVVALVW